MKWKEARTETVRINFLEDNWDDAGARQFDERTCGLALKVIDLLRYTSYQPPDSITPSHDGFIHFTWATSKGLITAEVGPTELSFNFLEE